MMKNAILYSIVLFTSVQSSRAGQLPEDAKKLVERLVEFEDEKLTEMNKSILRGKKSALRHLKKLRKDLYKLKIKWATELIDEQVARYKKEISRLEKD